MKGFFISNFPRPHVCFPYFVFGYVFGLAFIFFHVPLFFFGLVAIVLRVFKSNFICALFIFGMILGGILSYVQITHIQSIYTAETPDKNEFIIHSVDRRIDEQRVSLSQYDYPYLIHVKAGKYPTYTAGDILTVKCQYERPEVFDDFDYPRYLAYKNVSFLCKHPYIQKTGHVKHVVAQEIRDALSRRIHFVFRVPVAAFIEGLVLGLKGQIDEDVVNNFRRAGLSHVIVISGMHVAILSGLLCQMLFFLASKKRFFAQLAILITYLAVIGFPSSAVRGVIMGSMLLLSGVVLRRRNAFNFLLLAFFLMSCFSPHGVFVDAGFQLSFAATAGLLYIKPIIDPYFEIFPTYFGFRETLSASAAAIAATTPISAWLFHTFSLIAPLANVVIVPIVPWILMGSVVLLLLSYVMLPVVLYVSVIIHGLVIIILHVATILASYDMSSISVHDFSVWWLALMYVSLIIFVLCKK